ncbi:ABC transporter permease [Achromobacter spanius]|uniref:ABC transporter permease n=1 Tax=Achromobacter spanius TaxID=217203 RepID=A0AAW3HWM9_9BURK|nr:iron ABC transporter permease [Achromobacter spanius]AZS78107.1 iron ABC transporter permease [Achromobacter spanius]KNE24444.1 ABC transporter permease [Achromobacter spanius]
MKSIYLLAATTLAALAVLVALPMVFVALQAVFPHLAEGSLRDPFGAWPNTLGNPATLGLVGGTLKLGVGVATVSAAIGIPLGALRGLFRVPLARLWDLLFLVPFLLPPYIAALSWTMALQPRGYLEQLTGFNLGPLLFSPTGVTLAMGLAIFPVVYFAVSRSMAATGARMADVARVFGAGPWRAFLRVTLPLALPAIAASLLLAFTLAIEEYGVPAALGAQSGVAVLTTAIERRLADWPIDLPGASLLSLVLVALAMTAYAVQRAALAGRGFETTTGKPAPLARGELGPWRALVLLLFSAVALIAVAAPLASMLAAALTRNVSGGLSAGNLTLANFAALFDARGEAWEALSTSMSLASGTALLAGAVGLLAAWCVAGRHVRGAALIDTLAMLPAALPGVVVGVGLILAWNQPFWPVTPYGTWAILLLSYTCLLLPYPVRYVGAALAQIGANLEAAARVHGASAALALRRIVLPLVLPGLAASMLMVFAVASRELVTSLLLAPAGVQTVSIFVWRQFEQGSVGEGMAMAAVAVAVSLTLMLAAAGLSRRQER